jgi:hypothetical protein
MLRQLLASFLQASRQSLVGVSRFRSLIQNRFNSLKEETAEGEQLDQLAVDAAEGEQPDHGDQLAVDAAEGEQPDQREEKPKPVGLQREAPCDVRPPQQGSQQPVLNKARPHKRLASPSDPPRNVLAKKTYQPVPKQSSSWETGRKWRHHEAGQGWRNHDAGQGWQNHDAGQGWPPATSGKGCWNDAGAASSASGMAAGKGCVKGGPVQAPQQTLPEEQAPKPPAGRPPARLLAPSPVAAPPSPPTADNSIPAQPPLHSQS